MWGQPSSRLSGRAQLAIPVVNPRIRGQKVLSRCIILRMLGNRTNEQWISQYSSGHQNRVNRACHTLGIPTIVLSLLLFLVSIFVHRLWPYALALFLLGWILQFIGHAFEGKPPEFFSDWRFLFVGARWWWAKIQGKA
jgi:uncharacterized membrane protein YGL010W